jgi:hypothetical protein
MGGCMTKNFICRSFLLQQRNLSIIFLLLVFLSFMSASQILSQADTVKVSSDVSPGAGNLNKAIQTVLKSGKLSNTVFKLELDGRYVLTDSILVPAGEHLTIVAPEPGKTQSTAPPQILSVAGPTEFSPPPVKMMIKCFGDITLKNLWFYNADTKGMQKQMNISIAHSSEVVKSQAGIFENVIFDYFGVPWDASGAVGISSKHFNGTFKNCYWKNCIDPHFRYYGRAVSFPFSSSGWHIDKLVFENCTFANIGYVYEQEEGNYADEVKFNHCTFLNVVMYSLESGWWYKMSVTNSIFVNTYMYGDMPAETGKNDKYGGTIRIDSIKNFGYAVPFKEQERRILFAHSSYYLEKWLIGWLDNSPYAQYLKKNNRLEWKPQPQPMLSEGTLKFFESVDANGKKDFPFMNKANLNDGVNPVLVYPPGDTALIKSFLYRKWDNSTSENWAYLPEQSLQRIWPLKENSAYTNVSLLTAGMGSFPLGDLYRWFPEKYKQWKAQQDSENNRIAAWLETGKDNYVSIRDNNTEIPAWFYLSQNYPNPFNPTTTIKYSIPEANFPTGEGNGRGVLVTLKVFDLLGREITTLVNEQKSPGNYQVIFRGSSLPSRVYFYTLRAGSFMETKKMILLK